MPQDRDPGSRETGTAKRDGARSSRAKDQGRDRPARRKKPASINPRFAPPPLSEPKAVDQDMRRPTDTDVE
jgi:hypothetical protein